MAPPTPSRRPAIVGRSPSTPGRRTTTASWAVGWNGSRAPSASSRRCTSYLPIGHRGGFTGTEQGMVGDWLFGCDVCQDVCPWNVRFATPTTDPELAPRPELSAPELDTLLRIDPEEFDRRFRDSAFERPGPHGMRRNAAAVLANRR